MTKQQEWDLRGQLAEQGISPSQINQYVQAQKTKEIEAIKSTPSTPQKKAGEGFLKTLVKDPIKTLVVKPGTRIAQAGIGVYGAITGDERASRFAEQDISLDTPFGDYKIEAQKPGTAGVKQIAGDAAKSASYIYAPGGAKAAAKLAAGKKVIQAAKQGAKAGALTGGAYSGGEALLQDKPIDEVLLDTAKGAVGGAVVGGGLAAGGSAVVNVPRLFKGVKSQATEKAIHSLERKYDEIFTGTKSAKKTFTKSTRQGKTPSRFLAEHGHIVEVKNGKINTQPTIEKISKNAEPLEEVLDDILKTKDQALPESNRISLDMLGRKTKAALNTERNRASGYLQKQYDEVDNLIGELKASYGDSVNYSQLNAIKRGQWAQSKVFDATRPSYTSDIHYTLGTQAKETIEDLIPEADIKSLNRYLGDHFDAINNLQRIDGNAVKGGRLGGYFARTTGAIVGAQGGPLGAIAGAVGGDVVSSIMQNNYIANPIKRMLLQKITRGNPAFTKAQAALEKLKASQSMMRLPAPKAGSANKSIYVPINQPSKVVPPDKPFKGSGALSRQ